MMSPSKNLSFRSCTSFTTTKLTTSKLDGQTSAIWPNCWATRSATFSATWIGDYWRSPSPLQPHLCPMWPRSRARVRAFLVRRPRHASNSLSFYKYWSEQGPRWRRRQAVPNNLPLWWPSSIRGHSPPLPRWACAECPPRRQPVSSISFWVSVSDGEREKWNFLLVFV